MGQISAFTLVSMNNGDVYYISDKTAKLLQDMLNKGERVTSITFVDTRSGATVTLAVASISSIVRKEADHA